MLNKFPRGLNDESLSRTSNSARAKWRKVHNLLHSIQLMQHHEVNKVDKEVK
jgi:hypothetical protein